MKGMVSLAGRRVFEGVRIWRFDVVVVVVVVEIVVEIVVEVVVVVEYLDQQSCLSSIISY